MNYCLCELEKPCIINKAYNKKLYELDISQKNYY